MHVRQCHVANACTSRQNPLMADDLKTERVVVLMAPADLAALDTWRFANRISSRGEAIRRLVQLGLGQPAAPAKRRPATSRKSPP